MRIRARFLSRILVLICLCVWCVGGLVPSAAAYEAEGGALGSGAYTQDFESLEAGDLTADHWDAMGEGSASATVYNEEGDHGKILKIDDDTMQPTLDLSGSGVGKYEIKFDVKMQDLTKTRVDFITNTTNGEQFDNNTLFLTDTDSSVYLNTGESTSAQFYAGERAADTWYTVTAIVDLTKQLYSVKIADENGGETASQGGMPTRGDALQTLCFYAAGVTYIDNVSITPDPEDEVDKVIIDESFDNYDVADQFATDGDKTATPNFHHWSKRAPNVPGIQNKSSGAGGDKVLQITRTGDYASGTYDATLMLGNGHNPATNGVQKAYYRTGMYKLTFDWQVESGSDTGFYLSFVPEHENYSTSNGFVPIYATGGGIYKQAFDGKDISTKYGTYIPGQWYKFEVTVDLDTQKYDVKVSHNDQIVALIRDFDMTYNGITGHGKMGEQGEGFYAVDFISRTNNVTNIDNVKFEYLDNEEEWDGVITKPDFSQMTTDTSANYGWYLSNNGSKADGDVIIDPQDNTMTPGSASAKRTTSYFTNIKEGKIKVKMSLKWNDVSSGWGMIGLTNGSGPGVNNDIVLLAYNGADLYLRNAAGQGNGNLHTASKVESEKWYDIEWVLDLDNSTISYSVKEQDGGKVILPHKNDEGNIDDNFYSNGEQKTMEDIKAIEGIRMVASGKGAVIKDFSVTDPSVTTTPADTPTPTVTAAPTATPTQTPGTSVPTSTPGTSTPTQTPGASIPTSTPGTSNPTQTPGSSIPTSAPTTPTPTAITPAATSTPTPTATMPAAISTPTPTATAPAETSRPVPKPGSMGGGAYTQDFDTLGAGALTADYWDAAGSGSANAVVENGDGGHGNVLKIDDKTMQPVLYLSDSEGNPVSGKYEIKFDIKTDSLAKTRVDFITNRLKGEQNDNNTLFLTGSDSSIYLNTGESNSAQFYAGDREADTWYNVTAIVDLTKQMYSVKVADDSGKEIASQGGMPTRGNELNMLRFYAEGVTYIDNVSVKSDPAEEVNKVIIDEKFNDYDVAEQFATDGDKTATPNFHHWIKRAPNAPGIQNKSSDSDADKVLKITRTGDYASGTYDATLMLGNGHNPATNGVQKAYYRTGTYKLTFDWQVKDSASDKGFYLSFVPEHENYSTSNGFIPIYATGGGLYKQAVNGNNISTKYGTYIPGQWYRFEVTVDLDTQKYYVKVLHNNQVVAFIHDFDMTYNEISDHGKMGEEGEGFYAVDFISRQGNVTNIDNVKFEYLDNGPEWDYVIAKPDFGKMTTETSANYGWFTGNSNTAILADNPVMINGDGSIHLGTASQERTFNYFTNAVKGKLKIDLSLKWTQVQSGWGTVSLMNASGNTVNNDVMALAFNAGTLYFRNAAGSSGNLNTQVKVDAKRWYDFEWLVDLDNSKISCTVKDDTGTVLYTLKDDPMYQNGVQKTMTDIKAFQGIRMVATGGADMKNLTVTDYQPTPTMSDEAVTITDSKGGVHRVTELSIPADIKQITLDFNCELDPSTVGAITLKKDGVSDVPFIGSIEGTKYVMNINGGMLDGESSYTINVPGLISNIRGQKLGRAYTAEFKTAKIESKVELNGIKQGVAEISDISGLTAGSKLTVEASAANVDAAPISLTFISAYYSGNKMIYTEVSDPVTVNGHSAILSASEFTVPEQEILEQTDSVSFFVCDGINTLVPYCPALTLEQSDEE